jgi:hypothetical protein
VGFKRRLRLTVWFTKEAIAAWRAEPRTTRGRQPWYSPLAIRKGYYTEGGVELVAVTDR